MLSENHVKVLMETQRTCVWSVCLCICLCEPVDWVCALGSMSKMIWMWNVMSQLLVSTRTCGGMCTLTYSMYPPLYFYRSTANTNRMFTLFCLYWLVWGSYKYGSCGVHTCVSECATWGDLCDLQLYWWLWRLASSTFSSVSTWPKRRVSWVSLHIT